MKRGCSEAYGYGYNKFEMRLITSIRPSLDRRASQGSQCMKVLKTREDKLKIAVAELQTIRILRWFIKG